MRQHRIALFIILPILMLGLFTPSAQAKSWAIPETEIQLHLKSDGSLDVTESRTYLFMGEYSFIYQNFKLWRQSQMSRPILEGPEGLYRSGSDRSPGTYSWDAKRRRLDWYFQAKDETRRYTLSYKVSDAITLHADGAELHWQIVGSEWEKGTELLTAEILLPAAPIDVWFSSGKADLTIDGERIYLKRVKLPSEQAVAVRILLPKEAVPQSGLTPSTKSVDQILKRAGRRPDPISQGIHYAWTAFGLLAAFWFYQLHVKRPRIEAPERPTPMDPVLVGRLLSGQPTASLRAALAALALSGALRVEQEGPKEWRFTRVAGVDVPPAHAIGLEVMFPEGQDSITLSEWKKGLRRRQVITNRLNAWWQELKKELPEHWFLPFRWWGLLLALMTIPLLLLTSPGLSMIGPITVAVLLLLLSVLQRLHTEEGDQVRRSWIAERKRLSRAEVATDGIVLALALGLPLKQMLDPTLAIGQQLAWMHVADATLTSYGAAGGGGAGGNGGGGGGAG